MRYWYDTEFIEDGSTIDLISIAVVAEDGREFYAQSADFDPTKASKWVGQHVLPHLQSCPNMQIPTPFTVQTVRQELALHHRGQCLLVNGQWDMRCPWRTREPLKLALHSFLSPQWFGKPELWGYYSAYDHVALCQLFGTMMDLPDGWPMYTCDIKQWADQLGHPKLPEQGKDEHHALADARWNMQAWHFLWEYAKKLDPIHIWATSTELADTNQERKSYFIDLKDEGKPDLSFVLQRHADQRIVAEPYKPADYDYTDYDGDDEDEGDDCYSDPDYYDCEWKAFLGVASGTDEQADEQYIAAWGNSLLPKEAHGFFPHLAEENYKTE